MSTGVKTLRPNKKIDLQHLQLFIKLTDISEDDQMIEIDKEISALILHFT